jgi:hypothetical protein
VSFLLPLLERLAKRNPHLPILERCERELSLVLMITKSDGLQEEIVRTLDVLRERNKTV